MTNASFRTGRMSTDYDTRLRGRSPSGGSNRQLLGALRKTKPDDRPDMFMNASGRSDVSGRSNKMASSEIIVAADVKAKVNLEGQRSNSMGSDDSLVNQEDAGAKPNPFKEVGSTATSGEFGGKEHKRVQSRDTAAFAAGSG